MSYLLQNFNFLTPTIRYSLKLRSLIALRAVSLLAILLKMSPKHYKLSTLGNKWAIYYSFTQAYAFCKLFKIAFPKTQFLKYTPIGVNLPVSAQYLTLSIFHSRASQRVLDRKYNPLNITITRIFRDPYYGASYIHLAMLSKRPVVNMLYKFLFLTLNLWFTWPKRYSLSPQLFFISSRWFKIPFVNKYLFKIYSV